MLLNNHRYFEEMCSKLLLLLTFFCCYLQSSWLQQKWINIDLLLTLTLFLNSIFILDAAGNTLHTWWMQKENNKQNWTHRQQKDLYRCVNLIAQSLVALSSTSYDIEVTHLIFSWWKLAWFHFCQLNHHNSHWESSLSAFLLVVSNVCYKWMALSSVSPCKLDLISRNTVN